MSKRKPDWADKKGMAVAERWKNDVIPHIKRGGEPGLLGRRIARALRAAYRKGRKQGNEQTDFVLKRVTERLA